MARISDSSLRAARTSGASLNDVVAKRNKRLADKAAGPRASSKALHGQLGNVSPVTAEAVRRVEQYLNNMSKPYRRGS